MRTSIILRTATRFLVPLLLIFSFYLLLQGHHSSGGGFPAGLIAAGAYTLYAIAFGPSAARRALPATPAALLGAGLITAVLAGTAPLLLGRPFLEGLWIPTDEVGGTGFSVGTPVVFDAGVYLVVCGAVLSIIFELERKRTRLFKQRGIGP